MDGLWVPSSLEHVGMSLFLGSFWSSAVVMGSDMSAVLVVSRATLWVRVGALTMFGTAISWSWEDWATEISGDHPILIDQFLEDAFEFDVDAISDGVDVSIAGIMQHIEEAGIHSGDSACVIPSYELSSNSRKIIENHTMNIALRLETKGMINIQFAEKNKEIYIIEVNPRASRTTPFISKVRDIPFAKYAAQISVGKKIKDLEVVISLQKK